MKISAIVMALAVVAATASGAMAQGNKAKKSKAPACLNAIACGPQPVQQIRKPKNERFMKAAG